MLQFQIIIIEEPKIKGISGPELFNESIQPINLFV